MMLYETVKLCGDYTLAGAKHHFENAKTDLEMLFSKVYLQEEEPRENFLDWTMSMQLLYYKHLVVIQERVNTYLKYPETLLGIADMLNEFKAKLSIYRQLQHYRNFLMMEGKPESFYLQRYSIAIEGKKNGELVFKEGKFENCRTAIFELEATVDLLFEALSKIFEVKSVGDLQTFKSEFEEILERYQKSLSCNAIVGS